MAAPAFGTSGTYGQTSGGNPATSIGLAVPASVAADDIIVAMIFLDGATAQTITAPTGFTEATDSPAQAANHGGRVFWKRATGADSGTYTFSWGTSQYAEGQAHRFTGAITTGDPFDVTVSAVDNAFVSTSPAVSDTTTVADTLLLHVATNWSGGTWTAPSGFTKRMQGGFNVATLSDKAQAASGATGSVTATCSGTDRMTAWLGALKPAAGGTTHEAQASPTTTATITADATVSRYPLVETRSTGASAATNTTSHAITLPSGVQSGDLLVCTFSSDGNPTCTDNSSTWTKLGQASNSTIVTGAIFWKRATGSDALTITTSASEQSSHVVLRVSSAGDPTGTASNGSSTNSDPASHTTTSADILWIATRSGDSTVVATAAPVDYTGLQSQAAAGTGGASTNTAERKRTAATEDPGTFTSASEQWACWTLAIPYGSTTHTAVASVTATADRTVSAAADKPVGATTSSTATVTPVAQADKPVTASLTTTATVTADAEVGAAPVEIQASPTHAATVTPSASIEKPIVAAVSTAADVTATAQGERPADAGVTGTADISPAATTDKPIATTVTTTATITATASVVKGITATVSITATTTADATVGAAPVEAQAGLTVAVGLTVDTTTTKPLGANVLAAASITAMATVTKAIEAAVSAAAGITATGGMERNAQASLTTAATITAAAIIPGATVTPPERTHVVPAESRAYVVPTETRTLTVPADIRTGVG
jgi:hypothetical protein